MFAGFTSTPMPGETGESVGEDGEIQNPYYNPGFENLADDDAAESGEEEPTIPETEPQLQQAQAESGAADNYDAGTPPTEDNKKPDNAITETFGAEWDKGTSAVSIEDQQQHIEQNYADGAVEQAAELLQPAAEEAIQHANTDFEDNEDRSAQEQEDQENKNIAEAITAQAMIVNQEAQATSEAIALGSATEQEHAAKLQKAQEQIDQLASAGRIAVQDASSLEIAGRVNSAIAEAEAISDTATQQVEQTRANVEAAQEEAQEMADAHAEATGEDHQDLNFENLDDELSDDQKENIVDALVAENPNAPERE